MTSKVRRSIYDVHEELLELIVPNAFGDLGYSEVWLMDDGHKYTSRSDPRAPADFFCFAPADKIRFWGTREKTQALLGCHPRFF
jgi:hypothetical protein